MTKSWQIKNLTVKDSSNNAVELSLHRTMEDKTGEAKASGNLGNTLKVLGKFEEALACCEHHLCIARETKDKVSDISNFCLFFKLSLDKTLDFSRAFVNAFDKGLVLSNLQ